MACRSHTTQDTRQKTQDMRQHKRHNTQDTTHKTWTAEYKVLSGTRTTIVWFVFFVGRVAWCCVVKLSCFGAPLWWEIVSVSVIEIYGHNNYFSPKRRTEARQHDNTTHAFTERDNFTFWMARIINPCIVALDGYCSIPRKAISFLHNICSMILVTIL